MLLTSFNIHAQEKLTTLEKKSIYLEGDVVKMSLVIVRDWPFIEGEINGAKGLWMFDTGNSRNLSLHSTKVIGVESVKAGAGFVSSGQKFEVLEYPLIEELKVGNKVIRSLKNVRGINYSFLEEITPTVIGQVGFGFFDGYDLKIDYLRSELTFYKQKKDLENWKDIKKQKNYITSLPYFTRHLENHPMIKIQHKGINLLLTFDTGGGKGTFTLEDKYFEKLKNVGDLENFYDEPNDTYNWYDIKIDDHLTINLYGLDIEKNVVSHQPLQIKEKNTLTLDHSFLSQYITIWDTKNKVIHVFEKR